MGPGEMARGIFLPVQLYPMFDNALRAADGLDPRRAPRPRGRAVGRFSEVAATNPHAWSRDAYTAEELADAHAGQPHGRASRTRSA